MLPSQLDHHAVAVVSISGSCLDVLGSLYLAYDLLGGRHGPLRLLTRAVTYSIVFGIGYGLGLGLFFGLSAGIATGLTLAIEFKRAARGGRAGNRFESQEGTEGCLTRPDEKAVVNGCGTHVGTVWILSQALCQGKDRKHAPESIDRCIVSGYWEPKRKFLLTADITFHPVASDQG